MTTTMENTEYNGWKNYATWSLYTWLGSVDATVYDYFSTAAKQGNVADIERILSKHLKNFVEGKEFGEPWYGTFKGVASDWLLNSNSWVNWTKVHSLLVDKSDILNGMPDLLTAHVYQAMPTMWHRLVKGATLGIDKDSMLCDWFKEQVITWYETPEARKYTESGLSMYCRIAVQHYRNAVDWQQLYDALADVER